MGKRLPILPLTGGCSCGAIRYEIASFLLLRDFRPLAEKWRTMWSEFFPAKS